MAKSKKAKPKALLDSDSDSDSDNSSSSSSKDEKKKGVTFSINAKFAKEYQSRKQREELTKERQLRNVQDSDSDSDESSSSDEDEDADLLTTKLDVDILKTINALRTKNDKIYNPNVKFFPGSDEESSDDENDKVTKKSKPKRVKDVLREQILEQMEEDDNGESKKSSRDEKTSRLAYDEQQQELRKEFLAEKGEDDDHSEQDDDFLVIKKRHDNSQDDPETKNQFTKELQNLEESVKKKDSSDSTHKLVDPRGEVEDGEKFLLNFIKNKTWIDKSEDHNFANNDSDEESLEQLEKSDDFEARYNFRFEEAVQQAESTSGADHSIQGYARSQTMNTLRRKDETRRDKRLARKERKAAERKAKEEKLRRLKNAKREEIEQKMKQVKAVLGAEDGEPAGEAVEGFKDAPIDEAAIMKLLEGDFDPDKFEKSMEEAFGEDFYQKEDAEWKTDEDVLEALKKDGEVEHLDLDEDEGEPAEGHDDENDEDYEANEPNDEDADEEMNEDETELEKKVRAKMMDKLYELDYEDIVGGMPTRFKYREVEANNYGVSTEEILLARDQTLKQFVSLKKMAPYREGEEYHVSSRKRRKFREMLQQDVEDAEQRMKEQGITINDNHDKDNDDNGTSKKKKRRRMKKGGAKDIDSKAKDQKGEEREHQNGESKEKAADETTEGKASKRRRKKKGKKLSNALANEPKAGPRRVEDTDGSVPAALKPEDTKALEPAATEAPTKVADEKESKKSKKKRKKKKKLAIEGVSSSRLASYDL